MLPALILVSIVLFIALLNIAYKRASDSPQIVAERVRMTNHLLDKNAELLVRFQKRFGRYPRNLEEASREGYALYPSDHFRNQFQYSVAEDFRSYVLKSVGPDGKDGTQDDLVRSNSPLLTGSSAASGRELHDAKEQEGQDLGDRAVAYVKRVPARQLDGALPDRPFAEWLASLLPPGTPIQWTTNDCGEQTGDPSLDKDRNPPTCVTASVELDKDRLEISLAFATWESGSAGDPHVFFISLGQGSDALNISKLGSLPSFRDTPRTPAEAALYRMRWIRKLLDTQRPDANAWWHLQKGAEALIGELPPVLGESCADDPLSPKCPGSDLVRQARLGIRLDYCSPGEAWLVGNEGYEKYLELWPTGPHADEAFWHTRIEPPCCDECNVAFLDPLQVPLAIQACEEFLRRFPESRLREKAEKRINDIRHGTRRKSRITALPRMRFACCACSSKGTLQNRRRRARRDRAHRQLSPAKHLRQAAGPLQIGSRRQSPAQPPGVAAGERA